MTEWAKGQTKNRHYAKARLIQCGLAAGYIFWVFFAMSRFQSDLAVASLGASTFITFRFPQAESSRTRFLVGGYCVGAVWGVVCFYLIALLERVSILPFPPHIVGCSAAMFCCMFCMTLFQLEHPPSAALTLAVAMSETPVVLGLAAVACVAALCGIRHLLRKHLVNL